jgi:hypothetical protein
MGFYFRKSFGFGPVRLNLSRSGLGASFGVKGAHIGVGPRGTYVQMGRGGLYYRQTLTPAHRTLPAQRLQNVAQIAQYNTVQPIYSSPATQMVDSSALTLLNELNRVKRRTELFPISLVLGLLTLITLASLQAPPWILILLLLGFVVMSLGLRHLDVTKGTAFLEYSLEENAAQSFTNLKKGFGELSACQIIWHVDSQGHTYDWKRNAGVNTLSERSKSQVLPSTPPKVQCNLAVPMLAAGSKQLYFFPDRVLIYDPSGIGAVPYSDLRAEAGQVKFVECDPVPTDSTIVGKTWRYVSKSGGPDRRFNNNRELPMLLYGVLHLTSSSGLNEIFHCSRPQAATAVASAIAEAARIRALIRSLRRPCVVYKIKMLWIIPAVSDLPVADE